jgi:hypothetical protein
VSKKCNEANRLAQQASRYEVKRGKFKVMARSVLHEVLNVQVDGGNVDPEGDPGKENQQDWRWTM